MLALQPMSAIVEKYFILYSPHTILAESLPTVVGDFIFHVDTAATADALSKLAEKKMPAAIFLIQDAGKDAFDVINKLRTNASIDTVPIFAVNNVQDACKKMLKFVE